MNLQEAFDKVCDDASPGKRCYVSLYEEVPYYGGPEEGGWWGSDSHLVAYKQVPTEEEAEAIKEEVYKLAARLSEDAQRASDQTCRDQLDYCEDRLIDDSNAVFGEVAGATQYWVVIEDRPGANESRGSRHYE
jgi:hypothetical protein